MTCVCSLSGLPQTESYCSIELHTVKVCVPSDNNVLRPFCDTVHSCVLILQHLQAEKNLAWEAAQQQAQAQAQLNAMGAQAGSGPCKLLVTNLNVQLAVSLGVNFSLLHLMYALLYQRCRACTGYSVHTLGTAHLLSTNSFWYKDEAAGLPPSLLALFPFSSLFWHNPFPQLLLA